MFDTAYLTERASVHFVWFLFCVSFFSPLLDSYFLCAEQSFFRFTVFFSSLQKHLCLIRVFRAIDCEAIFSVYVLFVPRVTYYFISWTYGNFYLKPITTGLFLLDNFDCNILYTDIVFGQVGFMISCTIFTLHIYKLLILVHLL